MQVVITGGAGMLGKKLARELLKRGGLAGPDGKPRAIARLVLFDNVAASDLPADRRLTFVAGEIDDAQLMKRVISADTGAVFHFAAVVSAGAEADFDLGYRVNLDGTRAVLEACRALGSPPRLVFASSVAVFGGELPEVIADGHKLTPQTSYGAHKAMGELLIADYSRKGFIDGRCLRLPTIVVRPGKPNPAASTFASSIIREPLMGKTAVCPVKPTSMMPLLSPRRTIAAFIRAHDLPQAAWGSWRTLMLPSLDLSVAEMAEGLRRVAGAAAYGRIQWEIDPRIQNIVDGWPGRLDSRRARAMGFEADASIDAIINAFIEDDLAPEGSTAPR
ncbi:MAG: D-erythronate dehydrogenase [Pseudomonadota bacterium]